VSNQALMRRIGASLLSVLLAVLGGILVWQIRSPQLAYASGSDVLGCTGFGQLCTTTATCAPKETGQCKICDQPNSANLCVYGGTEKPCPQGLQPVGDACGFDDVGYCEGLSQNNKCRWHGGGDESPCSLPECPGI
jgi:hypothetical protein